MTQDRSPSPVKRQDEKESAASAKLQSNLAELASSGGITGAIASTLVSSYEAFEDEITKRGQMIGGIDQLWLLLENATDFNPVCAATYTYKGKMTKEKAIATFEKQAKRFPKYKQRLADRNRRFHGALWEDEPDFDVNNHITVTRLPGKAGKLELEALVGEFIARPWDYSRSLWESILIENYTDDEGAESAMITRGHHTLTDGQGFVLSQMTQSDFGPELEKLMDGGAAKLHAARRGTARPSSLHPGLRVLDKAYESPLLNPLVTIVMFVLFWSLFLSSAVVTAFWSAYMAVHATFMYTLVAWRTVMVTPDYPGRRVQEREFATSKRFSMKEIKRIQKAFSGPNPDSMIGRNLSVKVRSRSVLRHVTVNDVFVSIMNDVLSEVVALRKQETGVFWRTLDRILPNRIGFFIPISLRAPGDWSMRNLSTGAAAFVPQSSPSALNADKVTAGELHHQIHSTKTELNVLKHAALPGLAFRTFQWTGQAPILFPTEMGLMSPIAAVRRFARWATRKSMTSFQAILTNVPGPAQKPVSFEGFEVLSWTALPPQADKGTLGLGVISYAGSMCISVAADKVPGAEGVARDICERFERRYAVYLDRAEKVLARG